MINPQEHGMYQDAKAIFDGLDPADRERMTLKDGVITSNGGKNLMFVSADIEEFMIGSDVEFVSPLVILQAGAVGQLLRLSPGNRFYHTEAGMLFPGERGY